MLGITAIPHQVEAIGLQDSRIEQTAVLPGLVELQDYLGNLLVDAGAGAAADGAVNNLVAQDVSQLETCVTNVCPGLVSHGVVK